MTYRYRVATVFLFGFFIDCINIFMPAVALPRISSDFAVGSAASAWVANAYMLGLTLVIPLSTWLAGRCGARQVLATSMLAFAISAWGCGQASSFAALVAWRLAQGMAGGLLIPLGQALTFNLFQGAERARVSTLVMAVALLAPALSPSVGGLIVDRYSWPWVFHANLPLALLTAALAWAWIGEAPGTRQPRPDFKGLLLVSGALACLLLGMSLYGAGHGGAVLLASLAAGLGCAVLYRGHYRRHGHGIVELRLLASARLRVSMLVYHAIPGVFTGVNLLNIFYLQTVLGLSAQATGLYMIIYAAGALIAMLVVGRLYNRVEARRLLLLGLLLHSLGIALLVLVEHAADAPWLIVAYGLMGFGGGMGANTAQTTALLDFSGERTQQASVLWNLNRQMAFSVGATWLLMLFNLWPDTRHAYHLTFALAAVLGLLPALCLRALPLEPTRHAR
ncbi:MFS transporter [Pseudomonas xantholysinigenes]|uniref:MFS transporter n=1 Tax=Pseudomonas xantholysinigenes TaxID=2745490 RepID=A0A9E6Q0Q2_9PSED|nr:MFS transporter [Pseudomonas xantholysinigenes]QXI40338.1 MFS transporter [Pseudomonas xantholysinigenes]